jgi:RNA polymerase sigma factor (TIGR02999 family)
VSQTEGDITQLLQEWSEGSEEALARLMPLVYSELHAKARSRVRRERVGHILQPTELVNEVYLKLVNQKRVHWQSRTQFFGIAALLMRRILIDLARKRQASRTPPSSLRVSLSEVIPARSDSVDILWLDEALTRLQAFDPRQAQIVELRFFVGMSNEEVAETLGISLATVKREWNMAKAWLRRELNKT